MQRLFFHNQHDAESNVLFGVYQNDPTVTIYDVYGADRENLPAGIQLSYLPYLVDKQFVLTSTGPYTVGINQITIEFRDYQDNILTDINTLHEVYVNDEIWMLPVVDGVLSFEIDVPQPMKVTIELFGIGYLPFKTSLEVAAE